LKRVIDFYRALCVCYDIAAVERQFGFIMRLNSWQEVYAAMEAADEADGQGEAASPASVRTPA
jgi:hypothetical protein